MASPEYQFLNSVIELMNQYRDGEYKLSDSEMLHVLSEYIEREEC